VSTVAIAFLVLAGLLVWGGLVVSVLLLVRDGRRAPADVDEVTEAAEGTALDPRVGGRPELDPHDQRPSGPDRD
jgi:hypothetical protein